MCQIRQIRVQKNAKSSAAKANHEIHETQEKQRETLDLRATRAQGKPGFPGRYLQNRLATIAGVLHLNSLVLLFAGRSDSETLVKDGFLDRSREQVHLLA